MKNVNIASVLLVLGYLVMAGAALAVDPEIPPGDALSLGEISFRIIQVVDFIVITSGIVVTVFIIYAGIRWAIAGSDTTKVEGAKQSLYAGIIGAAIVLGVGVIVNTVEAIITRRFFGGFFW